MRPLFYDYPEDTKVWEIEDEYMYGDKLLVAPILEAGAKERRVYLPGEGVLWKDSETENEYRGGQWSCVPVTLESMPVFIKK